jgi:hypothetical protein
LIPAHVAGGVEAKSGFPGAKKLDEVEGVPDAAAPEEEEASGCCAPIRRDSSRVKKLYLTNETKIMENIFAKKLGEKNFDSTFLGI